MDPFILSAYKSAPQDGLAKAFSVLPTPTLLKLASGCMSCCDERDWLERFKGTPLYDQALALLQEEVQQEASDIQSRYMSQQMCSTSDQIRLKKRLLELELARQETVQPTISPAEQPQVPTAETLAPGAGTQPSLTPPEGVPLKKASSAPVALIRNLLEKRALSAGGDLGTAVWNYVKKNPGLVAGAGLGAVGGGIEGARHDGVTGALLGATGGGVLGGTVGLGAQGAIRSGLKAHEIMAAAKAKGLEPPGGLMGVLGRQASSRAANFARETGQGLQGIAGRLRSARNEMGQVVPVPPVTATPTPSVTTP